MKLRPTCARNRDALNREVNFPYGQYSTVIISNSARLHRTLGIGALYREKLRNVYTLATTMYRNQGESRMIPDKKNSW